jgi:hypothetical protein
MFLMQVSIVTQGLQEERKLRALAKRAEMDDDEI